MFITHTYVENRQMDGKLANWDKEGCRVQSLNIEEAKVAREQPSRRGSDNPHSFKQTAGFRTCCICGLSRSHKVHNVTH